MTVHDLIIWLYKNAAPESNVYIVGEVDFLLSEENLEVEQNRLTGGVMVNIIADEDRSQYED